MSARPPNVLLLMADQLPAAALPAYGHPCVRAPNLDALARDAVVFESAYCASPLCAPSRCGMLAGRRPSQVGVYDNAAELSAATPTITHLLRAAGYETTLAGKMHFVGPDQLHGFEERLTTDVYPATFDWTPDWRMAEGARADWYHNMTSLRLAGVREAALQTDYDDEVGFRAVQKLRELSRRRDRPFFLVVSFTNPHDPWEVRRRHWELYDAVEIEGPAVPPIPRERADPHSLRLRDMIRSDERPLSDAELVTARRAYYAAVSYLDERVGDVLDVLDETGLADDTAVLFTADHGEMLGERGLWYKMSFFEGSARVPLLLRLPGGAPGRVHGSVSQLDLAPTLAELAGAAVDAVELEGRSLLGLARGEEDGPRTVVGEYLAEGVRAPALMLRRGPHKYVACGDDPEQLYDLAADPRELENLAADPGRRAVLEGFREEAARRWDVGELERRVLASQRRRRLVAQALATGAYTPWDFQPYVDASLQFVRGEAAWSERPGRTPTPGGLPPDVEP